MILKNLEKGAIRFILYGLIPVGITLIIALEISSSLLINKSIFIPFIFNTFYIDNSTIILKENELFISFLRKLERKLKKSL